MKTETISLTAAAIADLAGYGQAAEPLLPPDRLSVEMTSPHFDLCYKRVGVRLNGVERLGDVQEYCVSEGWVIVRVRDGKGRFRKGPDGKFIFWTMQGEVVAFWKDGRPTRRIIPTAAEQSPEQKQAALSAAEAKRQRKAEKARRLATMYTGESK